jgi:hypothetical protein
VDKFVESRGTSSGNPTTFNTMMRFAPFWCNRIARQSFRKVSPENPCRGVLNNRSTMLAKNVPRCFTALLDRTFAQFRKFLAELFDEPSGRS